MNNIPEECDCEVNALARDSGIDSGGSSFATGSANYSHLIRNIICSNQLLTGAAAAAARAAACTGATQPPPAVSRLFYVP